MYTPMSRSSESLHTDRTLQVVSTSKRKPARANFSCAIDISSPHGHHLSVPSIIHDLSSASSGHHHTRLSRLSLLSRLSRFIVLTHIENSSTKSAQRSAHLRTGEGLPISPACCFCCRQMCSRGDIGIAVVGGVVYNSAALPSWAAREGVGCGK